MHALSTGPYLWKAYQLITTILITALTFVADGIGPQRVAGYTAASAMAKQRQVPLIVYVHGSDWNGLGQRLHSDMWNTTNTNERLRDFDLVLTDIDVLQTPTAPQQTEFDELHEGWNKQGLVTYPAIIAFSPNGDVLGSRQGETLPRLPAQAQSALLELAQAATKYQELHQRIEKARLENDQQSEAQAIYAVCDLPLDRPNQLIERLTTIDPQDTSGRRRRLEMPQWHHLIAQATKDVKEGRAQEALDRLHTMLADNVYNDSQRAWLQVAIGAVHRKTEGSDTKAAAAFKQAWQLDPDGIAGHAGKRWYLQFYAPPSLLFGWQPRHCTTELSTWIIEDLPSHMSKGRWNMTCSWTKGHHGLGIDRVELVDGETGKVVASDVHPGFTGVKTRDNTYYLELKRDIRHPRLQITCRSDGGTNSTGLIALTPESDMPGHAQN